MAIARFLVLFAGLLLLAACSGGDNPQQFSGRSGGVVIETVAPDVASLSQEQAQEPTAVVAVANETVADTAASTAPSTAVEAPTSGRWIDVDVTSYQVRLMEGGQVLQTIAPVAVGVEIDTGNYESTQTGLFHVYNKIGGLQYDAPYDAYISDWVAFDPDKDNGFHSFLQDSSGAVTDPSTGRISNGCIRSGASAEIFAFAEIGMPVRVHY